MDIPTLEREVGAIKRELELAITTGQFNGEHCGDGQKAKEALIRSSRLINRMHEVVKIGLVRDLQSRRIPFHSIHPPLGSSTPELKITGFIKAKDQDVVVMFEPPHRETIAGDGPMAGILDVVGRAASERSIVVGVRSQLSSVDKNFDTLMERAFAETLNLRLRLPRIVMGEVYVIPAFEYDDVAMVQGRIAFKPRPIKIHKFIRTFLGITGRDGVPIENTMYKYDRSALVVVDFRADPPVVFTTLDQMQRAGIIADDFNPDFAKLSAENFATDIVSAHLARHVV